MALLAQMMTKRVPNMEALILRLRKLSYLPAIWFILSRKVRAAQAFHPGMHT